MPHASHRRTFRLVALLLLGSTSSCAVDGTTPNHPDAPESTVAVARPRLDLETQRSLFERYDFETELLKEDVRQFDHWVEAQKRLSLGGIVPTAHERLLRVLRDAEEAAAQLSDADLRNRMESEVLGALAALAKSPCIVELLQQQRDEVERLTFAVELLREDVRLEPELRAQRRYTGGTGPTRQPVVERSAQLREDARRLNGRVMDPRLASDLDRVVATLGEIEASTVAPPAEPKADEAALLQEQRDIVEMLKFDLELLKEDVKQRDVWLTEYKYAALIGHSPVQQVEDGLARLRARLVQSAPSITDAQLAQQLKTDVLDPLDAIAKSSTAKR